MSGTKIKLLLTEDELQLSAIKDYMNKCFDWVKISKECPKGVRKTRSANRKGDSLYDELMAFKFPPIKLDSEPIIVLNDNMNNNNNNDNHNDTHKNTNNKRTRSANRSSETCSSDSDNETYGSRPVTRSLRSRSRTPTLQQQQQQQQQNNTKTRSSRTNPCTPQNQRLRSRMNHKDTSSGASSSGGSSNVLSAALNLQHPSVSVTKIRQLLRADSVQKKEREEKERQEKLMLDRKAKEERAEAQKKHILEERAITAKLKREERLNHAAEVRRAREEARKLLKQQEAARREQLQAINQQQQRNQTNNIEAHQEVQQQENYDIQNNGNQEQEKPLTVDNYVGEENQKQKSKTKLPPEDVKVVVKSMEVVETKVNETQDIVYSKPAVNETFKMPPATNNIDIIVQDETDDGQSTDKITAAAAWAKTPYLREALTEQFSKPYKERIELVSKVFYPLKNINNIELSEIFGSRSAVNKKYLYRTSSAVWTPPNRSVKRTSSQVTPTHD